MLRSIRWPLALLGLLLLAWGLVTYYTPRPLDWSPTFRHDQKKPLGTYALFRLLPTLPGTEVRVVRESPYLALEDSANAPAAYVLVQHTFKPGATDARALYRYLRRGGTVWLAANSIDLPGRRMDSLWALPERTELPVQLTSMVPDSSRVRFTDARQSRRATAVLPNRVMSAFFDRDSAGRLVFQGRDSLARAQTATVLARAGKRRPVLVHVPVGQGHLYLCTVPALLSNYGLLYRQNADFAAGALAYLPAGRIWWDEYYKQGRPGNNSLLRVVHESPALSWAWYALLGGGLLFMLLGARRRQRPVPTLRPLPNTTLQFVSTVAGLFRQGRNHYAVAELRIRLFFDYLRLRFQENFTDPTDATFQHRLSLRTGVPEDELRSFFGRLNHYLTADRISEAELHQLQKLLNDFRRRAES